MALHEEIRARGWNGGILTVERYLRQFRTADGRDRQARAQPQLTAPSAAPPPKPRQVTRWIMTYPDHLAGDDAANLTRLLDASPSLAAAAGHVRSFADIMTRRQGLLALEDWLTQVEADDQPGLHSFARGIRRDQQAVTAGLALPCSSGALEGKNCNAAYANPSASSPSAFRPDDKEVKRTSCATYPLQAALMRPGEQNRRAGFHERGRMPGINGCLIERRLWL
jgi:Transposase